MVSTVYKNKCELQFELLQFEMQMQQVCRIWMWTSVCTAHKGEGGRTIRSNGPSNCEATTTT